jgi:argonaute-like protein implicated in RNA metabolism and viral defense
VNSYGSQFVKDLKTQVEALYPKGGGYNPEIIPYDDLNGRRDFVGQSRAIKKAVEDRHVEPGYALVMVHRYDHRSRSADQLAAWIVKEFPLLFSLNAAVIHTEMSKKTYASVTRDGKTRYLVKDAGRKRFSGYLRNVALNKVLLTNGKWPFVLATPLYADVVIGIDVKNNTAAFALIADGGEIVRFAKSPSRQKEQLLKAQVRKFVLDLIRKEVPYFKRCPKQIVIHRDGRAWPAEIEGLQEACKCLAKDGHLDEDWHLTVVEISKSAPAPLRLFDVKWPIAGQKPDVENPLVGSWIPTAPGEGYVCTTGRPFRIPGTSNPLHIRRIAGEMPVEHCLSDVFALSCLTWTRPEGATRLPISIKLCDRILFDEAAEYDEDAIEFGNDDNLQEGTR